MRYAMLETSIENRSVENIPMSESRVYDITGLAAATVYTVEVAAVNTAGLGAYSDVIYQLTQG